MSARVWPRDRDSVPAGGGESEQFAAGWAVRDDQLSAPDQDYALKVRDALKAANIPYWIDVERMSGSIEEAMDEAVRNAAVVLV